MLVLPVLSALASIPKSESPVLSKSESDPKDYIGRGLRYARAVRDGEIPACKWVKAACQRQLDDLQKWSGKDAPYRFDVVSAVRVCQFLELMPHIKGPKAGTLIVLEPWQCFLLTTIFGWLKTDTGTRRFRKVYIEVPRGNAKSTLSSGIGLYMAFADGEGGADVYSAATTKDQARIVFDDARQMARKAPGFTEEFGVNVLAHNIHQPDSVSKFEPIASEDDTLDGKNIHLGIIDELHAHKTRGVHDVIETGLGKRKQSMLWEITTAGSNRTGICYEIRGYVTKILNAVLRRNNGLGYKIEGDSTDDEQQFGIVYTTDDSDDWTSEDALKKANPNYGVSVDRDSVLGLQRKAMQTASAVNNFLTKHLCQWVSADTAWLDMRDWDACCDPKLELADFMGLPVTLGIDLASKTDFADKVRVFQKGDDYYVFANHYLPSDAVEESRNSQYAGWVRDEKITVTPGSITDFGYIKDDMRMDKTNFEVREVAYDPFQATQLATEMAQEGFPMIETAQTVRSLSEPMKQLEALILSRKIHHNGDPVLAWMMGNVVCHVDVKENIYPRKEQHANKIDGAVALIMALGRVLLAAPRSEWTSGEILI